MTMFDAEETRRRRDEAMRLVLKNEKYKPELVNAIGRVIERGTDFSSDDIWREAGDLMAVIGNTSVIGPIIKAFARYGVIKWSGKFRPSTRPETHGVMHRIWTVPGQKSKPAVTRNDDGQMDLAFA